MPYAIHLLLCTQYSSFPVFDCTLHSMQHAVSDNLLHWEFSVVLVAFVRSSVGSLVLWERRICLAYYSLYQGSWLILSNFCFA